MVLCINQDFHEFFCKDPVLGSMLLTRRFGFLRGLLRLSPPIHDAIILLKAELYRHEKVFPRLSKGLAHDNR